MVTLHVGTTAWASQFGQRQLAMRKTYYKSSTFLVMRHEGLLWNRLHHRTITGSAGLFAMDYGVGSPLSNLFLNASSMFHTDCDLEYAPEIWMNFCSWFLVSRIDNLIAHAIQEVDISPTYPYFYRFLLVPELFTNILSEDMFSDLFIPSEFLPVRHYVAAKSLASY